MARRKPRPGNIQSIVESARPAELEGIENAIPVQNRQELQQKVESQAAAIQSEIAALEQEKATVEAETPVEIAKIQEEIGFQEKVVSNIQNLAAGNISTIVGTEPALDIDQTNALSIVRGYLKMWGLDSLTGVVEGWIKGKVSEDAALMNLRQQPAYKARFSGLALREKNNLPPIDEATYLALEDDYDAWARYYGVEGAFGTTREQREASFANLIGKNVNATTFKDYVDTVVTRVNRADPSIKQTLNTFYGITDTDLKNYYINPSENVKALQDKVTAAEIGAAGIAQALNVSRARAEDLARFGIDRERAIQGYERVAGALPEGQKLSDIYREEGIRYTQEMAEEEEFKGMESAARARRRLSGLAEASFGGSGGLTQGALGGRGTAGQI
jgi:hypothetical protein